MWYKSSCLIEQDCCQVHDILLFADCFQDFKNFQYTLPRVTGMYVHLEDKKAVIQLPQNRYDEVLR